MTSQTGKNRHGWRRAVTGAAASSAMAVGLMVGFGSPAALADPETDPQADASPTAQAPDDRRPPVADHRADYDLGSGGGQLSNLIDDVMRLRAQGFLPSNANKDAIVKALEYRPNQGPLIEALQETRAYQRKMQARSAAQPSNPAVVGTNKLPPGMEPDPTNPDNTGVFMGPGGIPIPQPFVP